MSRYDLVLANSFGTVQTTCLRDSFMFAVKTVSVAAVSFCSNQVD